MTDKEQAIFNYIAALEDVNDQLIISLKKSVEVLAQFTVLAPDPDQWQEMKSWFGFKKNIAVNCTGLVTEDVYPAQRRY